MYAAVGSSLFGCSSTSAAVFVTQSALWCLSIDSIRACHLPELCTCRVLPGKMEKRRQRRHHGRLQRADVVAAADSIAPLGRALQQTLRKPAANLACGSTGQFGRSQADLRPAIRWRQCPSDHPPACSNGPLFAPIENRQSDGIRRVVSPKETITAIIDEI